MGLREFAMQDIRHRYLEAPLLRASTRAAGSGAGTPSARSMARLMDVS